MLSLLLMQLLIPFLGFHAAATAASSSLPRTGIIVNESTGAITFPLIPHHIQRARRGLTEHDINNSNDNNNSNRRRRRVLEQGETSATAEISTDPEAVGALYMGYGTHYVDLWVGTPTPQRQTVIVDTGSAQTAFPCGGCDNCGFPSYHTDAYFEEGQSASFDKTTCEKCSRRATCNSKTDQCEIEQHYSEGSSWEAYEANDTCYVGGFHSTALLEVSECVNICDREIVFECVCLFLCFPSLFFLHGRILFFRYWVRCRERARLRPIPTPLTQTKPRPLDFPCGLDARPR